MRAETVSKAEVVERIRFGREAFDILVSVGMLPETKRPCNQPWIHHSGTFVTLYPTNLLLPIMTPDAGLSIKSYSSFSSDSKTACGVFLCDISNLFLSLKEIEVVVLVKRAMVTLEIVTLLKYLRTI
jgi:hypothetical protein